MCCQATRTDHNAWWFTTPGSYTRAGPAPAQPRDVEAPPVEAVLAGHRLFHYELPRHSFRQNKRLDFDGVVGYLDLAGDLGAAMPRARAGEVLHFGQKAAFGVGKVRVLVLE